MRNYLCYYVKNHFLEDRTSTLNFILHSGGRGEKGFVSIIFYSRKKPVVVAKIDRGDGNNLKEEYQNLKIVHNILRKSAVKKTIETPLSIVNLGGWVLFKEYKHGMPGDVDLSKNKKNVKKFLHHSTDWLIEFLKGVEDYHINTTEEKRKAVGEMSEGDIPEYLECWIEKETFFLAPSHSDLVASNFLINDSGITGVIDFENFTLRGFPEADLLGIVVSVSTTLFGLTETAIIKAFFEENYFSRAVCEVFKKYCNIFGIDPKDFIQIMPIYSDRAISIAKKWENEQLLNFHKKLRLRLVDDKNKLLLNKQ